jgi:hypothetical protein
MGFWIFRRSAGMSEIRYSIVCEDIAHKTFIEGVIFHFQNDAIQFNFISSFYKQFKANNSREVLSKFPQAVDQSFLNIYLLDLVLIGIDYDDRNREQFSKEYQNLYNKVDGKAKSKTVILFPVQAIEHWLLLLKHKTENAGSTKNVAADIEKKVRTQAKISLYGKTKTNENIIQALLQNADFDWLQNQSNSFGAFYKRLQAFIANFH